MILNNRQLKLLTLEDFEIANTKKMAQCLYNKYHVIYDLNLWNKFIDDKPNTRDGYMFTKLEWVHQIGNHPLIEKDGHTGATFGLCMRTMEYIAENGEQSYLQEIN